MSISIKRESSLTFNNNVSFCVGSGRMGLSLQNIFVKQLELVQKEIGFSHIRCHGLFHEDMSIYHEYKDENGNDHVEYNFTYLDMVLDIYKKAGVRPFIELGFMPKALASGDQTVFYWESNVTPPKSYEKWTDLVKATLSHIVERCGDEAYSYPVEVWNEPNLPGFWKDADMDEYFKLYKVTAEAVKSVGDFRVGGPAICGVDDERWMREFLKFVETENAPLDFITRHHYTTYQPEIKGRYKYQKLHEIEYGFDQLKKTREIVDSFEKFKGKEIHLTEFNTSYDPLCVIHDTNLNAAYVAMLLSRLGDEHASYSYWTLGDIFEEQGVPYSEFHGGFGLVNNSLIPKPTFWTFAFYSKLKGKCVYRSDDSVIVYDGKKYRGVLWNLGDERQLSFNMEDEENGRYCLITKTVDEETCNPLKIWHDMGEKRFFTEEEASIVRAGAYPLIKTEKLDSASFDINIKTNGVVYFELYKAELKGDRGYCYEKAVQKFSD